MASYLARYIAGEHVAVWAEMNAAWAGYGEDLTTGDPKRVYTVDREDSDAVMRETFARVARNTDRIIERLRDTGYRFECEVGRYEPAVPPRRSADLTALDMYLEENFGHLDIHGDGLPPLPPALRAFGEQVGSVSLKQREPYQPSALLPDGSLNPEVFEDVNVSRPMAPGISAQLNAFRDLLETVTPPIPPTEIERRNAIARADREPHPHADDPILSRLGDWDPLEVDVAWLTFTLTDPEAQPTPMPGGGLIWRGEFAASFEHKAGVSGGENPWIAFPQFGLDPLIRAEGHAWTFTEYLRHAFRHGGFLGVPRAVRADQTPDHEVAPGLFLPVHPIFGTLSTGLEPF